MSIAPTYLTSRGVTLTAPQYYYPLAVRNVGHSRASHPILVAMMAQKLPRLLECDVVDNVQLFWHVLLHGLWAFEVWIRLLETFDDSVQILIELRRKVVQVHAP